jgi:hypothetical protein
MKVKFLSKLEAQEYFKEPDDYALNLPLSNLKMICPHNPTVKGYQEVFLDSFEDFSKEQQKRIEQFTEKLSWLNLEVKLACTGGTHSLDITQTRKDVILVTRGLIGEATFIHEVYHVLSRKYPDLTENISKIFGFKKVKPQEIKEEGFLLNPDALVCDYSIEVLFAPTKTKYEVVPFVMEGLETGLKVLNQEEYIPSQLTNYEELIDNTSYLAHPEEICAEYFSLYHLNFCIFFKQPQNSKKIQEYGQELKKQMQKQGLIKSLFPQYSSN